MKRTVWYSPPTSVLTCSQATERSSLSETDVLRLPIAMTHSSTHMAGNNAFTVFNPARNGLDFSSLKPAPFPRLAMDSQGSFNVGGVCVCVSLLDALTLNCRHGALTRGYRGTPTHTGLYCLGCTPIHQSARSKHRFHLPSLSVGAYPATVVCVNMSMSDGCHFINLQNRN